ncbi:MAG: metallopeptidase family protein [Tissierellia bacterium]|nr:metallopeptidase family protein [Tissierellia bacterium]
MDKFPNIDEMHEILDKIAEEIPAELFEKLNQGIILLPEYKTHPESRDTDKLYIMGEYVRSMAGRHIVIYYGSFEEVYSGYSIETIEEKLKETLYHEFIHHLESLAGERDLEIEDARDLARYRKRI